MATKQKTTAAQHTNEPPTTTEPNPFAKYKWHPECTDISHVLDNTIAIYARLTPDNREKAHQYLRQQGLEIGNVAKPEDFQKLFDKSIERLSLSGLEMYEILHPRDALKNMARWHLLSKGQRNAASAIIDRDLDKQPAWYKSAGDTLLKHRQTVRSALRNTQNLSMDDLMGDDVI